MAMAMVITDGKSIETAMLFINGNVFTKTMAMTMTMAITNGKSMESLWHTAPLFPTILPAKHQARHLWANTFF